MRDINGAWMFVLIAIYFLCLLAKYGIKIMIDKIGKLIQSKSQLKVKCPHGVRGGQTKKLCPACSEIEIATAKETAIKAEISNTGNNISNDRFSKG